ncbi:MAG: biotin--[acetyl-CoA-carboxylase] ligase [Desulfobacteraceae bacterium]|nr:MAG: biotin--[acetyl-CoA-carboxylase] ligase [Desulfobacteraceae bacterium]
MLDSCPIFSYSPDSGKPHPDDTGNAFAVVKTNNTLMNEKMSPSSESDIRIKTDIPFPWEFPGRESGIHYFREVSSTMDVARDMAASGCPDFTVVIAEFQSMGRGRLQRIWHSETGGLYFTIVLRPDMEPALAFRINFAASLSLAKVLQKMFGVDAKVKWPNDILVNDRKLSGMLSEMGVESGRLSYVNLGIGINVNNAPENREPNAVSLKKLMGTVVDRRRLLSSFLDEFQAVLSGGPPADIISQWKQYTMTIGRHVKIITINDSHEGLALDVNDTGALIIEQEDGTRIEVIYGDCFHG